MFKKTNKKTPQKISRSLIYKEDGPLKLEILNLKSIKRVTTDSYILNSEGFGFPSVAFINEARGKDEPKTKMHFI